MRTHAIPLELPGLRVMPKEGESGSIQPAASNTTKRNVLGRVLWKLPLGLLSPLREYAINDTVQSAIRKAQQTGDSVTITKLERDRNFRLKEIEEERETLVTQRLVRQAKGLRVPVPRSFDPATGELTPAWEQGPAIGEVYLSVSGFQELREAVRREETARREARAHWIPWFTALTGRLGALAALAGAVAAILALGHKL